MSKYSIITSIYIGVGARTADAPRPACGRACRVTHSRHWPQTALRALHDAATHLPWCSIWCYATVHTFGLRLPLGPGGIPASAWGQASAPISRPTLCEQWWLLNVNVSSARSGCGAVGTRRRGRLARCAPRPARGARCGRHLSREPCRGSAPLLGSRYACAAPRRALLIMRLQRGPRRRCSHRGHCGTPESVAAGQRARAPRTRREVRNFAAEFSARPERAIAVARLN